ncbi:helix-turn-helix domain-containing protein [Cohnella sp. AR92]|uniref:helix-turn-helix domain-containing protein n=1 Tax=Cohnella sp. AR92 TaxID=648716 RepID=UPI000F8DC98E|nr:helix-turn-helix domain-containing protein [Cohnella sp. AR92]RUS48691.1 AraC family transcriptional regulator [Cohnella sp. AR92]
MKRWTDKIRLNSLFAKFFLSFVVLLAVVALTITALLSQAFSNGAAEQINEISEKRLDQSRSLFEILLDQARQLTLQLSLDNDLIQIMNSPDTRGDYFLYNATLRKLNDLLLTNKNIDSITLYNSHDRALVGTDRDKARAEADTIQWLTEKETVQNLGRAVPRTLRVEGAEEAGKRVYTFFYYDRNYESREIVSAIILNITLDSIANRQNEENNGDRVLILDEQGRVVFSPEPSEFLSDLAETPYIKRVLHSDTNGSFTDSSDGRKMLVSYTHSEQLGWYFVSAIPYNVANEQISHIRRTAVWTCLILLLLSLGVSAVLSGMLSSPLNKLARKVLDSKLDTGFAPEKNLSEMEILARFYASITEKYERLEAKDRSSHLSVKNEYLKELLHGIRVPEPGDARHYRLNVDPAGEAPMRVAVLKLDGIQELLLKSDSIVPTVPAVISDFAEQVLRTRLACDIVKVDQEVVALLEGSHGGQSIPDPTLEALRLLQQEVTRTYGVTLTIGLGQPACRGHEIGESYLTAKEAALYRLVHGKGQILFYEEVMSKVNDDFDYPYDKQKALLEAIKAAKEEKAEAAVADVFNEIRNASYTTIRSAISYLLFSVYAASSPSSSMSATSADFIETLGSLERMESLQLVEEWFARQVTETIQRSKENKKNPKSGLAEEIASFLEEQCGNPELSIEWVAERFHYNGIYFGRLFKELFNRTFLEYVTELRLRQANDYLTNTKLTVKEIGERVGFLNASYFVTWYKKHMGMAPTEYRKHASKSDGAL